MKRDIHKTMASLQDDHSSLAEIRFAALNDLSREEQSIVGAGWNKIALDKRQKLLTVLSELANDDFHMDFTALFRIALRDPDSEARRLAVEGLWMDENPTIMRPLLDMVQRDPSADVRAAAADRLGTWVLMGEYEEIADQRVVEIIETLLTIVTSSDEAPVVRWRALESLGYSHDERVPPLIERTYKAADTNAKRSALKAMGRHGDERWSATVRQELENDDPTFRFEAVRAVGEMADRGATKQLIALVRDNEREIREMAIWSLGEVGGKSAETALKQIAKGDDTDLRKLAREALTELKMLEDADDMAGLVLFNFNRDEEEAETDGDYDDEDEDDDDFEDEEDDEEEDEDDQMFRTLIVDANWDSESEDEGEDDAEYDLDDLEDDLDDDETPDFGSDEWNSDDDDEDEDDEGLFADEDEDDLLDNDTLR